MNNQNAYAGNNPISFVDPLGLWDFAWNEQGPLQSGDTRQTPKIWIENGGGGPEPDMHESINVGNPYGPYNSYGFGMNNFPKSNQGEVYSDKVHGGQILRYKQTTSADAFDFIQSLNNQLGKTGPYFPGASDCRNFSRRQFGQAPGQEATPPSRPLVRVPSTIPAMIYSTESTGGSIQPGQNGGFATPIMPHIRTHFP